VSSVALAEEDKQMTHYVYILRSLLDGTNYTGTTSNLKKRLQEHNTRGQKFTTTKRPYILLFGIVVFRINKKHIILRNI